MEAPPSRLRSVETRLSGRKVYLNLFKPWYVAKPVRERQGTTAGWSIVSNSTHAQGEAAFFKEPPDL